MRLVNLLNSESLSISLYLIAAILCVRGEYRERRMKLTSATVIWPWFWAAVGGLLVLMALARVGHVGGRLYFFGRREAEAGGWYGSRRPLQALVVAVLAVIALAITVVGGRRIGAEHRRYAPTLIVLLGLVLFSVVRVISLHQIDSVLYRRPIDRVRLGPVLDLSLILALIAAISVGQLNAPIEK